MLQLDPQKRITAKEMLTHPFFVNIQKVVPLHIYKYAERLLTASSIKSKPSTSITQVSRNPSASIGDSDSPKRYINNVSASLPKNPPNLVNNLSRKIQQPANPKQLLPAPSVLRYVDPRESQRVILGHAQDVRCNSLPINVSFSYLPRAPQKPVYFSPQRLPAVSFQQNLHQVPLRESRRNTTQQPQQKLTALNSKQTNSINIFIPFRR